jgi:hypothetical protein
VTNTAWSATPTTGNGAGSWDRPPSPEIDGDELARKASEITLRFPEFRDYFEDPEWWRVRPNRWSNAIHEAGHAVIGLLVGEQIAEVTIEPGEDEALSGYCLRSHYGETLVGEILSLMAGWAAEVEILGEYTVGSDETDRNTIAKLVAGGRKCGLIVPANFSGEDPEPTYEARLEARARRLCRRHAEAITAVAKELLARGRLMGDEIAAILTEITTRLTNRHKVRRYQVQYDYETGKPCCVSVYAATGGINSHWGWRAIWNRDHPLEGIAAVVVEKAGPYSEKEAPSA